jgi:RimJ/RimL family protein N-acetyltransferase
VTETETGELLTARLRLRGWRPADLPALAAVNADPRVMRWIGDGTVAGTARTREDIDGYRRLWEARGYGRYAVELRRTGEFIGLAGFAVPADVPELVPAVEIGWRLGYRHWGRGYATEAAEAALRYGFVHCGLPEVVGIHVLGNDASARVMVKLGMRHRLATVEVVHSRPVDVYAVTRTAYGQSRAPG